MLRLSANRLMPSAADATPLFDELAGFSAVGEADETVVTEYGPLDAASLSVSLAVGVWSQETTEPSAYVW